jgi:uncharacterized membrane protein
MSNKNKELGIVEIIFWIVVVILFVVVVVNVTLESTPSKVREANEAYDRLKGRGYTTQEIYDRGK